MFRFLSLSAVLSLTVPMPPAAADDEADIEALIEQYNRCEEQGDMEAQAELMTPDRVWVAAAGRRTDQTLNMKIQQAGMDRDMKRFPGGQAFFDVRDLLIRVYDDAATASFYWYRDFVLSPEQEGPNPSFRSAVSMFLVKQDDSWKIAHTHSSPFHPSGE